MRRDFDIIRNITLKLAADDGADVVEMGPEYEANAVLMSEAGLVNFGIPFGPASLTWKGLDFYELAKDDARWERVKRRIESTTGSAPFSIWCDLLEADMCEQR